MNEIIIDIHISVEEYLSRYKNPQCNVSARARDGRSIQFPANILQPFLLHDGIRGSFRISFDNGGKFKAINRY
jgi:hypothetical protein